MKISYAVTAATLFALSLGLHFLNHGLLGYVSLNAAEEARTLTLLGHETGVCELLQNTVMPFLSMITSFAVYGTLCFSVECFGPLKALPHIAVCVLSGAFPVIFSLWADRRFAGVRLKDLIEEYADSGYLGWLRLNAVLGAAVAAAVCAVNVLLYFIFKKRGYSAAERTLGYPMSRALIYSTLTALVFTLISDVQETAFDINSVGAPENGAEWLYIVEPYISLAVYAVAGYFTMRLTVHLLSKTAGFAQKSY